MIGEILSGAEAAFEAKIASAESKAGEADTVKANRDKTSEVATATVAEKDAAVVAAKTALAESVAAHKAAKAALATAESDEKAGNVALEVAAGKKTKLESGMNGTYTPIKNGTMSPEEVKDGISALVKLAKYFNFDTALLSSVPSALVKAPDARGSFDAMVLVQLEGLLTSHLTALEEELAAGEPAKAERAAKVVAAGEALTAAAEAEEACKTALKEAQAAAKVADSELKTAAQAVKAFKPEMQLLCDGLDSAKAE